MTDNGAEYTSHINRYRDLLRNRLQREAKNIEKDALILDMLRDINPEFGGYVVQQAQVGKKNISAIVNEVFKKHLRQSE